MIEHPLPRRVLVSPRIAPAVLALGLCVLAAPGLADASSPRRDDHRQRVLERLGARSFAVQALDLPDGLPDAFSVSVALDGELVELILQRHSLRAPGFRLRLSGEEGRLTEVELVFRWDRR